MRSWRVDPDRRITHYDVLLLGDRCACLDVLALYRCCEAHGEAVLDQRLGLTTSADPAVVAAGQRLGEELCEALQLADVLDQLSAAWSDVRRIRAASRAPERVVELLALAAERGLVEERDGCYRLAGKALLLSAFANRVEGVTVERAATRLGTGVSVVRRGFKRLTDEGWLRCTVAWDASGGPNQWHRRL